MAKPRLIGLHGLPRTGKDTLADLFVEQAGYVKLAFADPLYQEVSDAFSVSVDDLKSDLWKRNAQPALELRHCTDREFAHHMRTFELFFDEPMTSRAILQLWGTEYRRRHHGDDYWVGKMIGRLRALKGEHNVVLSDLRESIEAAMGHWEVSRRHFDSFFVVEVLRPGTASTGHSTDRGLSRFLIDAIVRNDGTPEQLYRSTMDALSYHRGERTDG